MPHCVWSTVYISLRMADCYAGWTACVSLPWLNYLRFIAYISLRWFGCQVGEFVAAPVWAADFGEGVSVRCDDPTAAWEQLQHTMPVAAAKDGAISDPENKVPQTIYA